MNSSGSTAHRPIARFNREFFNSTEDFTCIGAGEFGGKASGLAAADDLLQQNRIGEAFPGIIINIPRLTVLTTELFDTFLTLNKLEHVAYSDISDDRMALAFQQTDFPAMFLGDLMGLISKVHQPLAIRSSSLLEDALEHPFAGVYATKMIPNNQADVETRFHKLMEAIKYVYASTFFRQAKAYRRAINCRDEDEKMAVIIQEVIGGRRADRFYPTVSGVARSHNYYPFGHAQHEHGVVDLALGLGKTIVDGGLCWSYSPAFPHATPPYASPLDMTKHSQIEFWAVNMGKPPAYDPIHETEYLKRCSLPDAENDNVLNEVASTYSPESDRLYAGISLPGPRVINFAPILDFDVVPLNALIKTLLQQCEESLGTAVEIEFAMNLPTEENMLPRFGFLQVRPIEVPHERVHVDLSTPRAPHILLASDTVMGNGRNLGIYDVVYVKPESFDAARTKEIAGEIGLLNQRLVREMTPYVLIGFGRWGSSDPWLGIPANWSQVAGAKVLVEATLPTMNVDLSQGSHFFHNLSSFRVSYFSVRHDGPFEIQWDWLNRQRAVTQTAHVRHVRLTNPLSVLVDGHSGRGVIYHDGSNPAD